MKLLFVLEDFEMGGAQRHTVDLIRALEGPFAIDLLAIADMKKAMIPDLDTVRAAALGRKGLNPSTWPALGRAIAERSPDLVVTVNQIATLGVAIGRGLGLVRAPQAVIFHSTQVKSLQGWLRTVPFFPCVWSSAALVYVSENQSRLWRRRGLDARRTAVIRNGIRADRFTPNTPPMRAGAKAALGLAPDSYLLGMTAMLRREKNHVQLVEAVARLRARGLPAEALIVGEGPTREEIQARASALGVALQIHITGLQAQVAPFLAAMDVGVLTSTSVETLSLSALEAMATGLPMVMSDTGGASEIVESGRDGFLFPVGDTDALVARLIQCADPEVRAALGAAALAKVHGHFTYDRMAGAYADLFRAVGRGGRDAG
jgi:glycosyltransferase involved in cell wall biosynthesis